MAGTANTRHQILFAVEHPCSRSISPVAASRAKTARLVLPVEYRIPLTMSGVPSILVSVRAKVTRAETPRNLALIEVGCGDLIER